MITDNAKSLARIIMQNAEHLTVDDLAETIERYAESYNRKAYAEIKELRRVRRVARAVVLQVRDEVDRRWGDKPGMHGLVLLGIVDRLDKVLK